MRNNVSEHDTGKADNTQPHQKKRAGRAWIDMFKSSWRPIFQVDRAGITAFQAIRSAFGVVLPLALGVTTGLTLTGVAVASGAFLLGSVGLKDPVRTRMRAMLLTSMFITLSALIGGLIGSLGWLPVLVVGIWGFIAGMFASTSLVAQVVGVQACAALIIYAHLDLDVAHAFITAGLVCSGTLLQTLLAILPSPWTNTVPERTALAAIYQKLADYATNPFSEQGALLITDALLAGRTTLLHSNARTPKGRMFARLLEDAEHLRLTLSILLNERRQMRKKEPTQGGAGNYLDQILRASGEELQAIAQNLKPLAPFVEPTGTKSSETIKKALTELRGTAKNSDEDGTLQRILPYCTALPGELHVARKLATTWRHVRQRWPAHIRLPSLRPSRLHLEDTWSNMRANLTPRSSVFRHAIRLGIALALGTALYQIVQLPVQRGYWIPMTTAIVLRSDFITTFTRGIARVLGTMLGAVLTTLLLVFLAPSDPLVVVITAFAAYLMFATIFANYIIFSVATTMVAVFLLSFTHSPTLETAASRALDTAIGGLLALLVYIAWPTWERSQVPEYIAKRVEALGHFLGAVLQAYATPGTTRPNLFEKRHMASRLARSNALGSVQRSLQEPATQRVNADLAEGLLGAADNIARSVLALEAYLLDHPEHDTLPEMATFSATINNALSDLATTIRTGKPALPSPDLPKALQQFKAASKLKRQTADNTREQWHFVDKEAKRIVANTQAIQQLLSIDTFI